MSDDQQCTGRLMGYYSVTLVGSYLARVWVKNNVSPTVSRTYVLDALSTASLYACTLANILVLDLFGLTTFIVATLVSGCVHAYFFHYHCDVTANPVTWAINALPCYCSDNSLAGHVMSNVVGALVMHLVAGRVLLELFDCEEMFYCVPGPQDSSGVVAFALELVGTLLASGLRRSLGGALDVYAAVVRVFATWVVNAATGRPICLNLVASLGGCGGCGPKRVTP